MGFQGEGGTESGDGIGEGSGGGGGGGGLVVERMR